MSSSKFLGMLAAGAVLAGAAGAQTARTSPDQVICAMSGVCDANGSDAPSADRQIRIGQEKSFSLVKPSAMVAVPSAPAKGTGAAMATTRHAAAMPAVRRAPAPKPDSGRLDMLVTFPLGSATLNDASRQELQSFATAMSSPTLANMHFNVEGHTDAIGGRDYNLDLSKKRADAVVTYLTSLGVDSSRLRAEGFGFDKPRAGLAPKAPGNRRVEFVKAS